MNPGFRAALSAEAPPASSTAAEEPPKEEVAPTQDAAEEAAAEEVASEESEPVQGAPDEAVAAAEKALGKGKAEEKKVWKGKLKEKDEKGQEREEEVELPEEDVARMIARRRSLDRAAFGWSEKLKEVEKQNAELTSRLKEDPWTVLREQGQDPFQAALGFLKQQVDFAGLPPEQKAQIQLAQERQALESEKQKLKDDADARDRETKKATYRDRLLRELPAAMDKRGLVKHPLVISLLNDIGTAHMMTTRSEFPDLEYAAEEAEALLQEASAAWLGNLAEKNPAALVKALPPAVLKAVQAQALASAKKNPIPAAGTGTSPSAPRAAPEPKPRGETKPAFKTPQQWRHDLQAQARRR